MTRLCVCFVLFWVFLYRDALAQLFQALGLESRKAGDDGEAGYGIPEKGYDDSEAVIKQVSRVPRGTYQVVFNSFPTAKMTLL